MSGLILAVLAVLLPVAAILIVRSINALLKPALLPCHTDSPPEPDSAELDAMTWQEWMLREEMLFAGLQAQGLQRPRPITIDKDWNRSSSITPDQPVGAVVLLHGLTDSPYSLHHLGKAACAAGFAIVSIRLPGHGTVPASLKTTHRSAWAAATRLAMREAVRLAGQDKPVSIIGYSNGATLALAYAFDALENPALRQPARLILISPMIGLTIFARFAGIAAWPALLPGLGHALGRTAWLDIKPETNPFKYQSFPVNAAVQSERLTQDLQRQINSSATADTLDDLPPILAFQSVVDSTVSAAAVVDHCFNRLPPLSSGQSHELVLFDINRASATEPLQRESANAALAKLTDNGPRPYRTTIITNAADEDPATVMQSIAPGEASLTITPLGIAYPPNIISLSHIALPFPTDDPLYGLSADPAKILPDKIFGETDILTEKLDQFTRLTSNPFFPWLADRVLKALPKDLA